MNLIYTIPCELVKVLVREAGIGTGIGIRKDRHVKASRLPAHARRYRLTEIEPIKPIHLSLPNPRRGADDLT